VNQLLHNTLTKNDLYVGLNGRHGCDLFASGPGIFYLKKREKYRPEGDKGLFFGLRYRQDSHFNGNTTGLYMIWRVLSLNLQSLFCSV
jgi:hypothetical protein